MNKNMINYENLTNNERETVDNVLATLDRLKKHYERKQIKKSTYLKEVEYYEDFLMFYLGDNYLGNK